MLKFKSISTLLLLLFIILSFVTNAYATNATCNKITVKRWLNGSQSTYTLYENGTWYGDGTNTQTLNIDSGTSFDITLYKNGGTSPYIYRLIGPSYDSGDQSSTGGYRVFQNFTTTGQYSARVDNDSWKIFVINPQTCNTPTTPTLTAPSTAQSGSDYTVSWTSSSNATRYLIQESTSSSFTSPTNTYVTGTSKTFNHTATSSTTYYYRVIADNEPCSLTSGYSNTGQTTVSPSCSTPTTPTLTAPSTAQSGADYTVSWTSSSNATRYLIQESTSSSFTSPTNTYVTGTSKTFNHTVTSSTTYYYRVIADNEPCSLTSGYSNTGQTTICGTPTTPTLTAPSSAQSGPDYTVSWTSSSNATRYLIQESTSSSFTSPTNTYVTGTSKTFNHTVTSSTTYYYRVIADNEPCSLTSGYSNTGQTTICGTPTTPTLTAPSSAQSGPD